jgi:DNA polymerase III sliding clamp (beta) subunit (PCNA family)
MQAKKSAILKALDVCAGITTGPTLLNLQGKVLIDPESGRIVATDLGIFAVATVEFVGFTQTITLESEPVEIPGEDLLTELAQLKKDQIQALADYAGVELPEKWKIKDAANAIFEASVAAAQVEAAIAPKQVEVFEKFLIDRQILAKILKSLPGEADDPVVIKVEHWRREEKGFVPGTVSINGNFRTIFVQDADEFPEVLALGEKARKLASISGDNLATLVTALAKDDRRAFAYHLNFNGERKEVVACDGSRIHVQKLAVADSFFMPDSIAKKLLGKGKLVAVSMDDAGVLSAHADLGASFLWRQGETFEYPSYADIVDRHTKTPHWFEVETAGLLAVLSQAHIMSSDQYRAALLTFNGNGTINIATVNPDRGEYEKSDVPLKSGSVDEPITINMNLPYLLDAFKAAAPVAKIGLTDGDNLLFVKDQTGAFTAGIMPMRF